MLQLAWEQHVKQCPYISWKVFNEFQSKNIHFWIFTLAGAQNDAMHTVKSSVLWMIIKRNHSRDNHAPQYVLYITHCRGCLAILGNVLMLTCSPLAHVDRHKHLPALNRSSPAPIPHSPVPVLTSRLCLSAGQAYDNKQHFLQQFYIVNLLPLSSEQAVKVHLKALTSNLFTQHGYTLE